MISAINAIDEIMIDEGGIALNSKIVIYLLNWFNDFDGFGKNCIVSLLTKYEP